MSWHSVGRWQKGNKPHPKTILSIWKANQFIILSPSIFFEHGQDKPCHSGDGSVSSIARRATSSKTKCKKRRDQGTWNHSTPFWLSITRMVLRRLYHQLFYVGYLDLDPDFSEWHRFGPMLCRSKQPGSSIRLSNFKNPEENRCMASFVGRATLSTIRYEYSSSADSPGLFSCRLDRIRCSPCTLLQKHLILRWQIWWF